MKGEFCHIFDISHTNLTINGMEIINYDISKLDLPIFV